MTGPLTAGLLVPGLFAGVGVLLLYSVKSNIDRCLASRNWATTSGTITASQLLVGDEASERVQTYMSKPDDERSGTGGTADYLPSITYEYRVNGDWFESDRVSFFDNGYRMRSWAERVIRKYPNGTDVTVRYDPQNPHDATLQRFVFSDTLFGPIVGVLAIVAGIWFAYGMPGARNVVLLAGIGLLFWGLWGIWTGVRSKRWPTTTATVLSEGVKRVRESHQTAHETESVVTLNLRSRIDSWYEPQIEYQYTVDGDDYIAKTFVSGGEQYSTEPEARAALEEHIDNGEVTTHYDPDAPWRAVVVPGISRNSLFILAIGGFVTLAGVFVVWGT